MTVNGAVAERAARAVLPGDALEVLRRPRFVSRGGEKLEGALAALGLVVTAKRCIDVGASTGGFSDCLLQRGAAHVVAVDVGRAQLHERLRSAPQVRNLEGVNVRHLQPGDAGGPADLVTVDLSFIGLRLVMERLAALVSPGGDLLALVKPQFEAGRREASEGRGVIRSPEVWRRTLTEVAHAGFRRGAGAPSGGAGGPAGHRGQRRVLPALPQAGRWARAPRRHRRPRSAMPWMPPRVRQWIGVTNGYDSAASAGVPPTGFRPSPE